MRTFKFTLLNNFQICTKVLLTLVVTIKAGSLYLLTHFTHFALPPPPMLSLYLWVLGFFRNISSHIREIIYLSFSAWLTSLKHNVLKVQLCCHKCQDFPLFMAGYYFTCMHRPHFFGETIACFIVIVCILGCSPTRQYISWLLNQILYNSSLLSSGLQQWTKYNRNPELGNCTIFLNFIFLQLPKIFI